jgi:hypothetical protein
VTELCRIPERERQALVNGGLPVIALREDTQPRIAHCLARYRLAPGAWDSSRVLVDLLLDVGRGDGVRLGDRYEVQGEPVADSINHTVTGFVPLGQCVVQEPITEGLASCRLDRKQWKQFDRDHALTGGLAILREPAQ